MIPKKNILSSESLRVYEEPEAPPSVWRVWVSLSPQTHYWALIDPSTGGPTQSKDSTSYFIALLISSLFFLPFPSIPLTHLSIFAHHSGSTGFRPPLTLVHLLHVIDKQSSSVDTVRWKRRPGRVSHVLSLTRPIAVSPFSFPILHIHDLKTWSDPSTGMLQWILHSFTLSSFMFSRNIQKETSLRLLPCITLS